MKSCEELTHVHWRNNPVVRTPRFADRVIAASKHLVQLDDRDISGIQFEFVTKMVNREPDHRLTNGSGQVSGHGSGQGSSSSTNNRRAGQLMGNRVIRQTQHVKQQPESDPNQSGLSIGQRR